MFVVSAFASRANYADYAKLNGVKFAIYPDKAEIAIGGNAIATLSGLALPAGSEIEVKTCVNFIGGEAIFAMSVDGEWISVAIDAASIGTTGYVSTFAFTSVELTALEKEVKSFRVLFIGNSITNHGANPNGNAPCLIFCYLV